MPPYQPRHCSRYCGWHRPWFWVAAFPEQYAVAGVRVESGYQDGDLDEGMMPAGQGVEVVHEVLPAGEIVRRVVADAEAVLATIGSG